MITTLDTALFNFFNGYLRAPFLDVVLPIFSDVWPMWAALAIFFIIYTFYCQQRYGSAFWRILVLVIMLGFSALVADMTCNVIKGASDRFRPYQVVEDTYFFDAGARTWHIVEEPATPAKGQGYSMPSAHAATSMAIVLVIALLFHKTSPWIFFIPLLVGWSRVYMGKHYPLDVLVGWFVGIFAVFAVWWFFNLFFKRFGIARKL